MRLTAHHLSHWLTSPCALPHTRTQGWAADMKSRGYDTCDGSEALTARGNSGFGSLTPADIGSTVLRSARSMKKDMDEEAEMKAAMMARAAAKK